MKLNHGIGLLSFAIAGCTVGEAYDVSSPGNDPMQADTAGALSSNGGAQHTTVAGGTASTTGSSSASSGGTMTSTTGGSDTTASTGTSAGTTAGTASSGTSTGTSAGTASATTSAGTTAGANSVTSAGGTSAGGSAGTTAATSAGTSAGTTGATTGSGTTGGTPTGPFCDVQQLLKNHCQTCHASPPTAGAPMPLMTYADLVAPSRSNPSQTVAQLALARMQSSSAPMPPSPFPRVSAAEITSFQNWLSSGTPSTCAPPSSTTAGGTASTGASTGTNAGTASSGTSAGITSTGGTSSGASTGTTTSTTGTTTSSTGTATSTTGTTTGATTSSTGATTGNPYDTPSVCTSGTHWTNGNSGSPMMHPGGACITCHANSGEDDAPQLYIGGTVYPTAHEPNDCNGVNGPSVGASVVITDANGKMVTLSVNGAGNFLYNKNQGSIAFPIHAKVVHNGQERAMGAAQTTGNCNSCHTETGANGAPGRIMLP